MLIFSSSVHFIIGDKHRRGSLDGNIFVLVEEGYDEVKYCRVFFRQLHGLSLGFHEFAA